MIKLISPRNGAELSVMTAAQKDFIRRFETGDLNGADYPPDGNGAYDYLPPKKKAGRNLSYPSFTVFRWENDEPSAASFFEISESPDFDAPAPVSVDGIREDSERCGTLCANVVNLSTGKRYFWRAGDGKTWSEPFTFTTEEGGVRFIYVEGLANVRDLGGRVNGEGRRMKQGMIFRGPAIEAIIDPPYEITEKGKKTMREELGIKTEIDLREEAREIIRHCPLGDSVSYNLIPFESYGRSLGESEDRSFRQIFSILSDRESFPVYIHCQIGSDRTGTLAAYVLAALGFSERDIDLDYSINSLTITEKRSFTGSPEIGALLAGLRERFPADTTPEMMRKRILAAGVSEETIGRMREILTEDQK
ncbi:MAG: tyrosine-protein phosphatase [Clostridia bacterium]|nr:tyrosine-protein phosphatase [Clostridia bacterium]